MAEKKEIKARRIHHTGRGSQVMIYLGKQLRFFINENDWKVLPMAAIIAGLVSMVIRKRFFVNMEGSLIGAFALTCVAIWNGCFNSIQAVCRERAIIKREHRSGMHISAYIAAHMIYQLLLCTAQTGLTMFVIRQLGVPIPKEGFITPWMLADIGITMLLITYAADMMSLFLSSISRTTTGAMTLMPFVLIFQLIFSGGIIPLPAWSQPISNYTISNYGIRALASQSDYNNKPMTAVWNTLSGMKGTEVGGSVSLGQILDALDTPGLEKYRDTEVLKAYTVGEVSEILNSADGVLHLREKEVLHPIRLREAVDVLLHDDSMQEIRETRLLPRLLGDSAPSVGSLLTALAEDEGMSKILDAEIGRTITVGQVLDALHTEDIAKEVADVQVNPSVTFGMIIDFLKNNEALQHYRDRTLSVKTTVGDLIDIFGEQNVKEFIETRTAQAAHKDIYEMTTDNIVENWLMIGVFILVFALLATIALELIDKDKR